MKRIIQILLFVFSTIVAFAQPYGNEWINYSQVYLKIPITQEGLYRITYFDLNNGLSPIIQNISNIDPRTIRVFGRGEELYIHLEGENDGVFNVNDYIEFYARGNDGWFDSLVYNNPNSQNNPYYSLFNDTAFYFLTWGTSTNNRRMSIETDVLFSGYTSAPYFYKEVVGQWTSNYYYGKKDSFGKTETEYTASEGWFDKYFDYLGSKTKNISTPNPYSVSSAPDAEVTTVVTGVSNATQNPDHHLQIKYGSSAIVAIDDKFNGYVLKKYNFNIPASDLGSSTTPIIFSSAELVPNPVTDKMAVSYVKIRYAHTFDFSSEDTATYKLIIPANQSKKTYIKVTNFSTSKVSHIYDLTAHSRIDVLHIGADINALIPSGGEKEIYFATDEKIKSISDIRLAGTEGVFTDYSSMNIDSAYIIISNKAIWTEANDYKLYRESSGYNVVLADINELYEQFAYGINKHPFAIRGFCDYMLDNMPSLPQNLFLLGKSITAPQDRKNTANYYNTLVPSFGYPASDILLTAGLNGTLLEPPIPTGRLAAKNGTDVENYLSKVKEYEANQNTIPSSTQQTLENKEWMKNVLHFGGGSNASQGNQFRAFLNKYENIIEGTYYGGNVTSFYKNTTDPFQSNVSEKVLNHINNGVSLITFFGHSGSGTFDISMDSPKNYNNKGKYFILIANGCYSGNIHLPTGSALTTSEEFVLIKDKAAVAFIATVDLGYVTPLDAYTTNLYTNIGVTNYRKSIGMCMKETIKVIQNTNTSFFKAVCLEMTLHGDPALIVNTHLLPDYVITDETKSQIFFTPENITTETDSFDMNIIITNIGKAIDDTFSVEVTRIFPVEREDEKYFKIIPAPYYKDTVSIRMPVDVAYGIGLNTFDIWVDNIIYNEITEIEDEVNNHVSIETWIKSIDLVPIYPYNYAVIPSTDVILKASTADPFAPVRDYQFQIDTTDLYNSPLLDTTIINSSGGVLTWKPKLLITTDSIVYFWRVSPYSVTDTSIISWREHSFQYIPDKRGWGQAHYFQFKKDNYNLINYNRAIREFSFDSTSKQLKCENIGNPKSFLETQLVEYSIDNVTQFITLFGWGMPMIHVAVIDSLTLKPWETQWRGSNPDHDFGNYNQCPTRCRSSPDKIFAFRANVKEEMDSLREMLNNKIPEGNHVLIYTGVRGAFQDSSSLGVPYWEDSHFAAFENLGADSIRYVDSYVPYIFYVQKGNLNSVEEVIGTHSRDRIEINVPMLHNKNTGNITSTLIGPTKKWGSLHWRQHPLETNTNDEVNLQVLGVRDNGIEKLLKNFSSDSIEILNLYDYVDANDYPYLKLNVDLKDDSLQSPAQMDRWQVLYEGIPEAAVNPILGFSFIDDTLQEGEVVQLSIAIHNISEFDMDSLRVAYWISQQGGIDHPIIYSKQDSLRAGEILIDTVSYSTKGLSGINSFWVEANPIDSLWQLEQYHFNNFARVNFLVEKDNINPLLDVTFDGIHILDGDIVSPTPEIVIQLKDENLFLALDDTSDFDFFIINPENEQQPIYFTGQNGEEVMKFTPAVLPNNSCKIEYPAIFTKDGTYKLIVQAKDKSDNMSGDIDYNISFEVISKSTITNVLNYPNPFTTSTRFVFTLTGSEIPDYFKIQILTVTGKVVKEITQEELGTINIGRNITQYAWDGTDEFGDRLANGVYLYRVITKIKGEDIERLSTDADQYFYKEFGKMYLMR